MLTAKRPKRASPQAVADAALEIADLREQLELATARSAAWRARCAAMVGVVRRTGEFMYPGDQDELRNAEAMLAEIRK